MKTLPGGATTRDGDFICAFCREWVLEEDNVMNHDGRCVKKSKAVTLNAGIPDM